MSDELKRKVNSLDDADIEQLRAAYALSYGPQHGAFYVGVALLLREHDMDSCLVVAVGHGHLTMTGLGLSQEAAESITPFLEAAHNVAKENLREAPAPPKPS